MLGIYKSLLPMADAVKLFNLCECPILQDSCPLQKFLAQDTVDWSGNQHMVNLFRRYGRLEIEKKNC